MVRSVLHTAAHDNYRFKGLIEAIVMSDVFRMNVTSGTDDTRGTLHTQVDGPAGSTTTNATTSNTTASAHPGN